MRKIGSCPPICARALNGRARNSYKQEEERQMTRREMREHCFKILFGVEFYPTEEIKTQVEQYLTLRKRMTLQKTEQKRLVHNVEMKEVDRTFLTDRVEGIVGKIPELDARIDEVAQGWKTSRMGKVELTILRQAVYEMQYDARCLPRWPSMRR